MTVKVVSFPKLIASKERYSGVYSITFNEVSPFRISAPKGTPLALSFKIPPCTFPSLGSKPSNSGLIIKVLFILEYPKSFYIK